jgi:ATP-dependent protease ClpP protease subunit
MNQVAAPAPVECLTAPQVRLHGRVSDEMLGAFLTAFAAAEAQPDPVVVEVTTYGGDADVGIRIATDVRLFRERTGRRPLFLGKAQVFSTGVAIMSGFPVEDRWMTKGTRLLIHDRSLARTVDFNSALRMARKQVEGLLNEIDMGLAVEREVYQTLLAGSDLSLDELYERSANNWYLSAEEALERRLIAGVV